MRGVKNLAYDLDMIPGAVNSRVVLLLRSIEAKPWHLIFERNLPIIYSVRRVFEGVEGRVLKAWPWEVLCHQRSRVTGK